MRRTLIILSSLVLLTISLSLAEDRADLAAIYKIKDEGLNRSQVMEILSYLTDVYGPRLPGDSNSRKAAEWVQGKFREWGLQNVHAEKYDFGRSWTLEKFSAHMLEPTYSPLIAYPKSWTPGTDGPVQSEAMRVQIDSEADIEKYRGKLKGLFVLIQPPRDVDARFEPLGRRYTEEMLKDIIRMPEPGRPGPFARMRQGQPNRQLIRKTTEFFLSEGVAAVLEAGRGDGGTVFVGSGGERGKNAPPVPPQVVLAVEHYNRICRILEKNIKVKLEVDIRARFLTEDLTDVNIIAEIPGTDKKDELVMLGGHFDTLHTGTGATDNGAGCAVSMEAARIIQASGLHPRRTIRVALWGAEELGFVGSRAYVSEHFAVRPQPPEGMDRTSDEYRRWMEKSRQTPPTLKPEWSKLSAYFNYDNGTGKIRGIYCQGNEEVRPIFEAWLVPFHDLGATAVTMRNTGGTDHVPFDEVGLPGFQFIQDPVEYDTRTHHSNMDVYDRIQRGDIIQSAIVMASFVYHTAMREEKLPRKPLPQPKSGQPPTTAR
ncbi:MAG: M20/M25/M40 family metallo-hydrolase [Acidobacteria bacterium]|nr:M20/M25/M40 family metallo-hydrolase [Acidobacteriota bacterium]